MSENCIVPIVKHGSGVSMVWGSFGFVIAGDFAQIKGIMLKEKNIFQYSWGMQFLSAAELLEKMLVCNKIMIQNTI